MPNRSKMQPNYTLKKILMVNPNSSHLAFVPKPNLQFNLKLTQQFFPNPGHLFYVSDPNCLWFEDIWCRFSFYPDVDLLHVIRFLWTYFQGFLFSLTKL